MVASFPKRDFRSARPAERTGEGDHIRMVGGWSDVSELMKDEGVKPSGGGQVPLSPYLDGNRHFAFG